MAIHSFFLLLVFSWLPLICPYPVMIGCFRKRIPCIKLYHFRIHYRAARFTDFYVGPIIRCLLTWLKLTILPHRFHPFTCFPCYYYQVPSFHVKNKGHTGKSVVIELDRWLERRALAFRGQSAFGAIAPPRGLPWTRYSRRSLETPAPINFVLTLRIGSFLFKINGLNLKVIRMLATLGSIQRDQPEMIYFRSLATLVSLSFMTWWQEVQVDLVIISNCYK